MNILLIDKEEKLLDLLEELIEFSSNQPNLHIEKAQTFDDATRRALQNGPDLVVIDPQFVREGGMALIKTIKDFKPATQVVALSNCAQEGCPPFCREQCLDAGANHHYDKQDDFMRIPTLVRELTCYPHRNRFIA